MSRYTQPEDALKSTMARMKRGCGELPPPKLVSAGEEGQVEIEVLQ